MATFEDHITTREDAGALIPEEVSSQILGDVEANSFLVNRAGIVARMGRKQTRMPVLAAVASVGWVDGDTGVKPVTNARWANRFLNAEALAGIAVIPDDVLADAGDDLWESLRKQAGAQFARGLDQAAIFKNLGQGQEPGDVAPRGWPLGLAIHAISRGAVVTLGSPAVKGGLAEDVNQAFAHLEDAGFDAGVAAAHTKLKARARGNRDAEGRLLGEVTPTSWYGVPVDYPARGLWTPVTVGGETYDVKGVVVDPEQIAFGLCSDISYLVSQEATVSTPDGPVNLFQQDSTALRVVGRFGFQIANTFTFDQPDEAQRSVAAVLVDPAGSGS
jgi:HK97 family phage major capsid protein